MELLQGYLLPCLYAFGSCVGFCILFNIHTGILLCAIGGALGWLVYLAAAPLVQSDILQSFLAALFISAYSEIMARIRKCPVTGFLVVPSSRWCRAAASTTPWSTPSAARPSSSSRSCSTPWGWPDPWRWGCCWCPPSCAC